MSLFDLPEPRDSFLVQEHVTLVAQVASVARRMEESALTAEVIRVLQDKGYVVREAEDFEATLLAERERVYAAYTRLICEDECSCIPCLREAVEGDEGDPSCTCPETDPGERAATYTVARMDLEPHSVACPRWGRPRG